MLLHTKISDGGYNIILASQSPRRRDLMRDAGLVFRAVSYDVEEVYPADTPAEDVAQYLSQLKSSAYPENLGDRDILITADTVVLLNGKILGKPHSQIEAIEMLSELSNSEH
ncbi:MAG: Maf family protein, partial [Rikenellaceae bacterium]